MSEQELIVKQTCYGYPDNDPPNSDQISHPVVHRKAGGTGTYTDPITVAVAPAQIPYGTLFYVRDFQKYLVAEDWCQESVDEFKRGVKKVHLDVWVGGKGARRKAVLAFENSITNENRRVIMNPKPDYPVIAGPLYSPTAQGHSPS
jgi:3D (Asp-Asp-Asp) domain-containing protein